MAIVSPLHGQQTAVQDLFVEYERVLQLEGHSPVRTVASQPYIYPYISPIDTLSGHPWQGIYSPPATVVDEPDLTIGFHDPESRTVFRNLKPGGINNGAMWEGRGFTSSLSAGAHIRYRFLSASFRPIMILNENRSFALSPYETDPDRSEFGNPHYRIDTPQRFGDGPFWTMDPGPSYVKADYRGFEAGLSNQNRWWGPGQHYSIVMSNNAPGFWHFFLGTRDPKDIYIGDLETTLIWGKLVESDYFDDHDFNDERYMTGINLSLSPRPVPNLTVGMSRTFYRTLPPEGIPPRDLFRVFEAFTKSSHVSGTSPGGDDVFSQLMSLNGRWVFPESGFELYGEWARNDHSWNLRDAVGEPEHSRAYMLGFQKSFALANDNLFAITAEMVQMETTKTSMLRSDASWYTHHLVRQGYTHRGQIIGMGYGPGSNSQLLHGDYYFDDGKISGWLRRTAYDNDTLYRSDKMVGQPGNSNTPKFWLHNFEMGMGSSVVYFFDRWESEFGIELMREFNEDFVYKNDKTILAMNFRLRYRLSALR